MCREREEKKGEEKKGGEEEEGTEEREKERERRQNRLNRGRGSTGYAGRLARFSDHEQTHTTKKDISVNCF